MKLVACESGVPECCAIRGRRLSEERRRAKNQEKQRGGNVLVVRRALWALPCLGLLGAAGCAATPSRTRRIALTFDDAPLPGGPFFTGEERSRRIVAGLQRAGVREAAFFANPGRPEPDMQPRLRAYAGAGHALANHTATHPNLRDVSVEAYLADIAAADRVLRPMPGFRAWFRFPYLSEGETAEKRDAVRRGLIAIGYEQGYVTADSYDWRLDQLAREAKTAGRAMNLDALRELYVRSAVDGADYFDRMAQAVLRRSPRHVLLLHENDLAALFIVDLVEALRRDGWTIITASEGFSDPIASELPDTLALDEGRIGALVNAAHARNRFREQRPGYNALDQPFSEQVTGVR
jgi:peptidoglycan/xylan/chitin deacetylase (PgdA/CDA1 family)